MSALSASDVTLKIPALQSEVESLTPPDNRLHLLSTLSELDLGLLIAEAAMAPRNADGSLPNNGFARLVLGSDLIDRGVNVGLPYKGLAPDLGAYEYQ